MIVDKIFIDSNILIYLLGKDEEKKQKVVSFLSPSFITSTQVVGENVNACLRKLKLTKQEAFAHGKMIIKSFLVKEIHLNTIENAFIISEKYQFQFWDSLIIATALENECDAIYTEDLTNGQVIEKKLRIVNPFILS